MRVLLDEAATGESEAFDLPPATPSNAPHRKAVVESDGSLRLLEQIDLRAGERALVTLLGEDDTAETALLSEPSLAADWNRVDEDEAWAHLQ